jgi:hypothetical protein
MDLGFASIRSPTDRKAASISSKVCASLFRDIFRVR